MPRWAKPMATPMPTGPAPTITTGSASAEGAREAKSSGAYFFG
ncbi:hypothetical protein N806_10330 [Rhodococcus sp. P27]|nr:hypothetical protein N806_10330 [Rhodococcus sp. P27]